MKLISPAFGDHRPIPTRYAYHGIVGGKNISIPLVWQDAPIATQSFALLFIDRHPIARQWVHWLVLNIPSNIQNLAEGISCNAMPAGAKELYNSFGTIGYGGPQPPKNSGLHIYECILFALHSSLDLSENSSLRAFQQCVNEKIITTSKLTGIYEQ